MKMLGVERIISVSAVGSLREDLPPLDFLIPDQFFDRTRGRVSTFFGGGIVAHVGFDKPTCAHLSAHLADACDRVGVKAHRGGTYVCMEGPQFSTLAESHTYRQLRFDVIGMTNLTEAKLAREAEICYATFAMITDYDCWHPQHDAVTLEEIIGNLNRNTENVQRAIREAVRELGRRPRIANADRRWRTRSSRIARRSRRPRRSASRHHRQIHFVNAFLRKVSVPETENPCHFWCRFRAFDAIETPYGKVDRTLGGAASYFALAASHFTPVRVVAIVGEDFTEKERSRVSRPQNRSRRPGARAGKDRFSGPAATARI